MTVDRAAVIAVVLCRGRHYLRWRDTVGSAGQPVPSATDACPDCLSTAAAQIDALDAAQAAAARDPDLFCPEHGGTTDPDLCEHDDHPVEPLPPCTCAARHLIVGDLPGPHHSDRCGLYAAPLTLPTVTAPRGGIRYPTGD